MATTYNPRIVTDGLVLYLDAANPQSYPGSGTTWTDLSRNGNHGTLTNGPTFNSNNRGSIVFDGVNDYVSCSSSDIFNNFSYDIWCLPQATHQIDSQATSSTLGVLGQKYLIGPQFINSPDAGSGISVGTNGVSVYEHSASYMPALLSHEVTITSPVHIVVNYTNKQPSLYLNGNFIKNGFTSPRTNVKITTELIGRHEYGSFNGILYNAKFYNRVLSAAEVAQNFNAIRERFGV